MHGVDKFVPDGVINFLSKLVNMHINRVGKNVGVAVPDAFQDFIARQKFSRVQHQKLKQNKFLVAEMNGLIFAADFMGIAVQLQITHLQDSVCGRFALAVNQHPCLICNHSERKRPDEYLVDFLIFGIFKESGVKTLGQHDNRDASAKIIDFCQYFVNSFDSLDQQENIVAGFNASNQILAVGLGGEQHIGNIFIFKPLLNELSLVKIFRNKQALHKRNVKKL